MPDYMLRVLNRGDHQKDWPKDRHTEFVKKCEVYIGAMQKANQLHSAQPLSKQGAVLSGTPGHWHVEALDTNQEIQVGYYHIKAKDLAEAIELAKGNPEFAYSATARVEVRPLKAEEKDTGFVYPT